MSLAESDRASNRSPSAQADTAAQIGWTGYSVTEQRRRLRSFSVTQHLVADKSPASELRSHRAISATNADAFVRRPRQDGTTALGLAWQTCAPLAKHGRATADLLCRREYPESIDRLRAVCRVQRQLGHLSSNKLDLRELSVSPEM